jgi:hypothetical protein
MSVQPAMITRLCYFIFTAGPYYYHADVDKRSAIHKSHNMQALVLNSTASTFCIGIWSGS